LTGYFQTDSKQIKNQEKERKNMTDEVRLSDILISSEPDQELEITVGNKSFVVAYRKLSWLEKSACISKATDYSFDEAKQAVKTEFLLDVYYREALRRMLVKTPFPMGGAVLDKLNTVVGEQFATIIPKPFESEVAANLSSVSGPASTADSETSELSEPQSS
jgi:hypothetical protein